MLDICKQMAGSANGAMAAVSCYFRLVEAEECEEIVCRKMRFWVHVLSKSRRELDEFHRLLKALHMDRRLYKFRRYFGQNTARQNTNYFSLYTFYRHYCPRARFALSGLALLWLGVLRLNMVRCLV